MFCFFFFNDTATTEIYTLSLHDALPIFGGVSVTRDFEEGLPKVPGPGGDLNQVWTNLLDNAADAVAGGGDRKSTRLNSSHANISYAVFCLKKKKIYQQSR